MNNQKPKVNYPSQLAFLLGFMGVSMVLSAFLIPLIGGMLMHVSFQQALVKINLPENANIARLLNTLASLFVFFFPALALARILSKRPFSQLGFRSGISPRQILLLLGLSVASIMLSGALGELNEWIPLPAKWYAKAKEMEEAYKASMLSMATMRSLSDYLLSLIVLAAAPAIFEEVLFRSGFQQVFVGWTQKKWMGILITSVLFSAFHFSYFGFLPRLALGMVLGLIFYYSKNIWLSILLHFLNNAIVVTQLYIAGKQGRSITKTMDESIPVWWGLLSVCVLVVLFRLFKKESIRLENPKEQFLHSTQENNKA
ncbi:MAG: CPBP family intramembrane metalloprotease [Bacteroidota bacterium]|nr:CPBP family intramembrane metalloprotease [Bacteroidota bacterium]